MEGEFAVRQYKLLYSIGDSISIGYLRHLVVPLAEHYTMAHCPGNGGPSTWVRENLSDWMAGYEADVVLLNCGLHDIMLQSGQPATLPDQYGANLRDIIDDLTGLYCSPRIVWCSSTPISDERHQAFWPFERRNQDVVAYNQIADEVMAAAGIEAIDLYRLVVNNDPDALLAADGAHFTDQGYQVLAEAIADYLIVGP